MKKGGWQAQLFSNHTGGRDEVGQKTGQKIAYYS